MTVADDPSARRLNESRALDETHEMADESDDGDGNYSMSAYSVTDDDGGDEAVRAIGVNNEDDAVVENGDPELRTSLCVEACNPKSFKQSPFMSFVSPDQWDRCERDDQEAGYVLEEIRQRLLGLCAPGKGNWKVHPERPNMLFLPLPVTPLAADPNYVTPTKIHGLVRIMAPL